MKASLLTVTVLVSGFVLLGLGTGWVLTQQLPEVPSAELTEKEDDPLRKPSGKEVSIPDMDVDGEEIPNLPRYPGSRRVVYKQEPIGDLILTRVEYLAEGDLNDTREFYRDAFRKGEWTVVDVGYSRGDWTYLVTKGHREAVVKIQERASLIEVQTELSEVRGPEKIAEPAPQQGPAPRPVPSPVREQEGDDDGSYDD